MNSQGSGRQWNVKMVIIFFGMIALFTGSIAAQDRFPRPDFQTGYTQPQAAFPSARPVFFEYIDVALLIIALFCAAYFALRRRLRIGLFLTMIMSVAYFGFYRKGCICPVGAVQNVTAALSDSSFIIPITVVLFFSLPLLFTLLFGRVFCAAVCPLGGVQDLVALRPKRLPGWLESALGVIPHVYLGTALLFAATGAGFIICRFDPFVGIFRRSASVGMVVWGAALLLTGVFVARPYCRFLCPYGVLLGWMSALAKRQVTITPDDCIQCRLCVDACPFNAIQAPRQLPDEPRARSLRRLLVNGALLPVWILLGAIAGYSAHRTLARMHPQVHLAEQLFIEEQTKNPGTTIETQTFRAGTMPVATLIAATDRVRRKFRIGSILLGCYLGAGIGVMVLRRSLLRTPKDYTPDRQTCISCGRCFRSCPKEHQRLKKLHSEKRLT